MKRHRVAPMDITERTAFHASLQELGWTPDEVIE